MSYRLSGRTVLITGATGGIGAAAARELARRGAHLALADVPGAPIEGLAASLPGAPALPIVMDVTSHRSVQDGVAAAVDRFGGLDVVIANAGIAVTPPVSVRTVDPKAFEKVLDVDLLGVWRTVHHTLPHIVERKGYVMVTSSIYAHVNGLMNAPYAMSKVGIEALVRSLRVELAGHGATAGAIYPGWVATPLTGTVFGSHRVATELRQRGFPGPLGKAITPERVARAMAKGIERRASRVHVPAIWGPASGLRGLVSIATDAWLERDPQVRRYIRELEDEAPGPNGP